MGADAAAAETAEAKSRALRTRAQRHRRQGRAQEVSGVREPGDRLGVGGGVWVLRVRRVQGEVPGEVLAAHQDGVQGGLSHYRS